MHIHQIVFFLIFFPGFISCVLPVQMSGHHILGPLQALQLAAEHPQRAKDKTQADDLVTHAVQTSGA